MRIKVRSFEGVTPGRWLARVVEYEGLSWPGNAPAYIAASSQKEAEESLIAAFRVAKKKQEERDSQIREFWVEI
jgi:hypothetical protein